MHELAERLLNKDTTLWPAGNVSANRLGWLDAPDRLLDLAHGLQEWVNKITLPRVVLLGMGGSSLGPEVFRAGIGSERLLVLDTTDPATIAEVNVEDTFFIVSSKSGSTLEVQALLAYFWDKVPDPSRWAAITDEGTELQKVATARKFNRVFTNPPDIGGRFSVLSYFGLVPAAFVGYDVAALCEAAKDLDFTEAVELGEAMAAALAEGRDKVTIVAPPGKFSTFGLWAEQLLAESTGKDGRGLIPVPTTEPEIGNDRFIERITFQVPTDLGNEFFRWQVATSVAGSILEIDPFSEPNVAESKANTARVLAALPVTEPGLEDAKSTIEWLKSVVTPGDYVSLQAYLPYSFDHELEQLRRFVRDELDGIAVTAGFGPRFLHSTGQLHKGGPNSVVAVQLVPASPTAAVPIPGMAYDFATLINAQSVGDYQSLKDHGRRVRRVAVNSPEEVK